MEKKINDVMNCSDEKNATSIYFVSYKYTDRKIVCWHNYRQPTLGAKRENFHDTEKYETDNVKQEAQAGA